MEQKQEAGKHSQRLIWIMKQIDGAIGRRTFELSLLAIAVGVIFHAQLSFLVPAVPYVFAFMTLFTAMGCSWRQFGDVGRRPLPVMLAFGGLHIIGPVVAKLLGTVTFGGTSPITVGLVLAMAVPTGMTSVMWAGIAKANLPLSIAIVSLDSLLSPVVVPATIRLLAGKAVSFDALSLLHGLCIIILIPTVVGVTVNDLSRGQIPSRLRPFAGPYVKLGLLFVIAANVAGAWPEVSRVGGRAFSLLGVLLILAVFGYLQGFGWGRLSHQSEETTKTLIFSVGMRNISAGIVIAMTYFPPEVAIPVVASTLFQQPMATLTYRLLSRRGQTRSIQADESKSL